MKLKKSQLRKFIRESIKELALEQVNTTMCQELVFQMQSQGIGIAAGGLTAVQNACCPKCPTAQNDPGDACYSFCNHDCCPDDPCDELATNPTLAGCCDKCASNMNVPSFQNDPCFPYCECCDFDDDIDPCSDRETAHEECFWCPGHTTVTLNQPPNQCQTVGQYLNMALNNNIPLYSDVNDCTAAEAGCVEVVNNQTEQCHCCKKSANGNWEAVSMVQLVAVGDCDSLNGYSYFGSPNQGFFNNCRPISEPLPAKCGKKPITTTGAPQALQSKSSMVRSPKPKGGIQSPMGPLAGGGLTGPNTPGGPRIKGMGN